MVEEWADWPVLDGPSVVCGRAGHVPNGPGRRVSRGGRSGPTF